MFVVQSASEKWKFRMIQEEFPLNINCRQYQFCRYISPDVLSKLQNFKRRVNQIKFSSNAMYWWWSTLFSFTHLEYFLYLKLLFIIRTDDNLVDNLSIYKIIIYQICSNFPLGFLFRRFCSIHLKKKKRVKR